MDNFIFLTNFIVLDCEDDFEMPIILGRTLLATGRALVDMERGALKFRLSYEKVTFNVHKTMKQSTDIRVASIINYVDNHGGKTVCYLDEV